MATAGPRARSLFHRHGDPSDVRGDARHFRDAAGLLLYLSFTGYAQGQGLFSGSCVGLENYHDLLSDPVFTGSIAITSVYTAAAVAAEMGLGLGIALLLNVDLPGIRICRIALIIPMMVTPIVGALCWKLLLDPSHGVINHWIGQHIASRPGVTTSG